jgi:hypothetical protein
VLKAFTVVLSPRALLRVQGSRSMGRATRGRRVSS